MVAAQLWQATGKTSYLEESHKIYFNGIAHGQRANGGFGCDKCLGSKDANLYLSNPEAWWCCSMRGSEGLMKAVEYSFVQSGNTLMLPFFNDAKVTFNGGVLNISTAYPYEGAVTVKVEKAPQAGTALAFFKPSWAGASAVALNGQQVEISEKDSFVSVDTALNAGDTLVYTFKQQPYLAATHNIHTIKGYQKVYQGPLVLGAMAKKEMTFPKNSKLNWMPKTKSVKVGKVTLTPINDVIDTMYERQTYKRQVLWKKH